MNLTGPQRRCIEESFGHPSALVAGAGSGKTATLTNRIVYALSHPDVSGVDDINQILAITFTTKAAEELKGRIKSSLQTASASNAHLAEQALKVDGAWISTIHGMCSRIIRENAFTLGIDPAFRVLSNAVQDNMMDAAMEHVLVDDQAADVLAEYSVEDVKQILAKLLATAAESALPPSKLFQCPPTGAYGGILDTLVDYYERMIEAALVDEGKSALKWADKARDVLQNIEQKRAADASGSMDLAKELQYVCMLPHINKTPKCINEIDLTGTGETTQEVVYPMVERLHQTVASTYTHTFVRLAEEALSFYQQQKVQQGVMDNGDLMRHAYRLLTDPAFAELGQSYGNRFKLIMVDEFQDTNQMQVDMISLLSGGAPGKPSARMCVVGDAQQSIYAFRGADLSVFQDYVAQVDSAEDGDVIHMGHNFRSNPEILAFSKAAFENTFGTGKGGSFLELLPGRKEDECNDEDKRKHVFNGATALPAKEDDADLPRRVNVKAIDMKRKDATLVAAEAIAQDFKRLLDAEPHDQTGRKHRPSDMAILLAGMNNAPVFAQALQRQGIPCAITGGSVFGSSVEPEIIMKLCQALVDMHDTEALTCVLTSDIFALEAEDLIALMPHLRLGGEQASLADRFVDQIRFLDGIQGTDIDVEEGASTRLNSAIAVLCKAATRVGYDPFHTIVGDVLVESGWLHRIQDGGTAAAANAFKTLRLLEQVGRDESLDAASLVRVAAESLKANKETPGVLNTAGDDCVRIMTIHASKGLQFPIVAVAEAFPSTHRKDKLALVSDGGKSYFSVKLSESIKGAGQIQKDAADFVFNRLAEADDKDKLRACLASDDPAVFRAAIMRFAHLLDDEEYQRKLYVAYTRAQESLIVCIDNPAKARENGEVSSRTEIERTLCNNNSFAFEDGVAYSCQTYPVQTVFEDPEKGTTVLDWAARVETYKTVDEPEDSGNADGGSAVQDDGSNEGAQQNSSAAQEDGAGKGAQQGGPATQEDGAGEDQRRPGEVPTYGSNLPFLVPQQLLPPKQDDARYRLMWSQGILSASSLKHEKAEEEQGAQEVVREEEEQVQGTQEAALQEEEQVQGAQEAVLQEEEQGTQDTTPQEEQASFFVDYTTALMGTNEANERVNESTEVDDADEAPALATEKGTAFHAMGEMAARAWEVGQTLAMPPKDRLEAIARLYGLNNQQTEATIKQLEGWLACPVAQKMASYNNLVAEAPFWVQLSDATNDTPQASAALPARGALVLQGFIDLLAYDTLGNGCAYVVDYKTGTFLTTEQQRRDAYHIQAKVYAYALLCQGFSQVKLSFVFVEQPDADGHPQVVEFPAEGEADYTIDTLREDLTTLVDAIGDGRYA